MFDTPNEFAAILLLLIFPAIGLFVRATHRNWTIGVLAAALCLCLGVVFARTYSRGAYITFVMVAPLLITLMRSVRLATTLGVILVVIGAAAAPSVGSRVQSVGEFRDYSILNRLAVWKASAILFAHHPSGVGREAFPKIFNTGYKPLTTNANYATAVSTYLTIGCWWGLPALLIALSVVAFPAAAFFPGKDARGENRPFLGAGFLAFAIAACFSPFVMSQRLIFVYAVCWCACAGWILWRDTLSSFLGCVGRAAGWGAMGSAGIFIAGAAMSFASDAPRIEFGAREIRMARFPAIGDEQRKVYVVCEPHYASKYFLQEFCLPLFQESRATAIVILYGGELLTAQLVPDAELAVIAIGNNAAVSLLEANAKPRRAILIDEVERPLVPERVAMRFNSSFKDAFFLSSAGENISFDRPRQIEEPDRVSGDANQGRHNFLNLAHACAALLAKNES